VLTLRLESLRLRLMHGDLWHLREVVAAGVIALLIAELVAALAFAHALAVAVQAIALLTHLLAIGHDDAAVVLGVLEIVLRQHRIAR
jgi:FtsH-binding integral membrane protein